MTPDIDALLTGPLSFAHGYLALVPGDGEAIRGHELRRPEVLRALLDRYCQQFGKADRRAAVSMWMQSYAVRLVYPVLAANLMAGRDLPLALDDMTLLVGPEGGPRGFVLPHAGGVVATRGMARFAPLVRDHLDPLIEALSRVDRITPRLAWSNAGIRISGTADIARRAGRLGAEADEDVTLLLGSASWPDGWPNPVLEPYRVPAGGGQAQRRVCCLRYLLPGFAGCGASCPVPGGKAAAQEAA